MISSWSCLQTRQMYAINLSTKSVFGLFNVEGGNGMLETCCTLWGKGGIKKQQCGHNLRRDKKVITEGTNKLLKYWDTLHSLCAVSDTYCSTTYKSFTVLEVYQ